MVDIQSVTCTHARLSRFCLYVATTRDRCFHSWNASRSYNAVIVHAIINPQFFARAVLFASHSVIFTARSELCKVLFLALSMTFLFVLFVCESNISRTAERICAKFTGKTCFIPRLRSNSTYSICCGFVRDLLWTCCTTFRPVVDLLWICCRLVDKDKLYNISTCCGFVVDFRFSWVRVLI